MRRALRIGPLPAHALAVTCAPRSVISWTLHGLDVHFLSARRRRELAACKALAPSQRPNTCQSSLKRINRILLAQTQRAYSRKTPSTSLRIIHSNSNHTLSISCRRESTRTQQHTAVAIRHHSSPTVHHGDIQARPLNCSATRATQRAAPRHQELEPLRLAAARCRAKTKIHAIDATSACSLLTG